MKSRTDTHPDDLSEKPTPDVTPLDDADIAAEFERLRPELRAYVTSILGSFEGVDDVVQEAAVVILQKREVLEEVNSFKAWCLRIAYFKALAFRRDEARRGQFHMRVETVMQIAASAEEHLDSLEERRAAMRSCIEAMSPEDREVLQSKYVDGENLTAYAKRIRKTPNQIHKMISRARGKLRQCMTKKLS